MQRFAHETVSLKELYAFHIGVDIFKYHNRNFKLILCSPRTIHVYLLDRRCIFLIAHEKVRFLSSSIQWFKSATVLLCKISVF
jgi:hypothetical protein